MASYQTYGDASTEANVVRSNTQSSTTTSEITSTTDSTSFQSSTTGATTTSYQILSSSTSYAPQASQTTHTTVIDYKYERLSNRTGNVTLDTLGWDTVANAPFGNLCDDGNCLETCQNYTQVFRSTYDIKQESNITLFGICTNLGTIYGDMYQANSSVLQSVSSYFPLGDQSQGVVNQVAADLSSCLAGSCDASRDPQHCNTSCSLSVLNYGNTTINMNAVSLCINDLCKDTYGLPYADQDVYGIGILISYVMQAIMGIMLALFIIFLAIRRTWITKKKDDDRFVSSNFRKFIKNFLAAQCYFGISLQAAALYSRPKSVNPLNGYATMTVAVTGFLPTVFTLMLLRYYGAKSRYLSLLAFLSWLLATVVFFELESNLNNFKSGAKMQDSSLRQLYDIPTCGGSSALAVCSQTLGSSPLDYLSGYYNNAPGLVSLRNTNILWVWSTLCLVLCLISQLSFGNKERHPPRSERKRETILRKFQSTFSHMKMTALTIASSIFTICFVYQALMVWRYQQMGVIDWTGWTFGQIMAVATWIPSILEYLENELAHTWKKRQEANDLPGGKDSSTITLIQPQSPDSLERSSLDYELDLESHEGPDTGDDCHQVETHLFSQKADYNHGL